MPATSQSSWQHNIECSGDARIDRRPRTFWGDNDANWNSYRNTVSTPGTRRGCGRVRVSSRRSLRAIAEWRVPARRQRTRGRCKPCTWSQAVPLPATDRRRTRMPTATRLLFPPVTVSSAGGYGGDCGCYGGNGCGCYGGCYGQGPCCGGGFNSCMPMGAGGTDPPIGYDLMNDAGMQGECVDQRGPALLRFPRRSRLLSPR